MTVIDDILDRFGYISQRSFDERLAEAVKIEIDKNLPVWLGETADKARWSMPDPSIFATQADMYRLSPLLGTAVDILGRDVGTAKFSVKRMVGEEVRDIPNHEYELLLRNPNPIDSGLEYTQFIVNSYLLNGNAIEWLNRASQNDKPDEIWPIPFSMVQPIPDKRLYIDHYDYFPSPGSTPLRLETWEIVHYKTYNPNNRFVGLSPLESLAVTLQGDLAMRKTNTQNYAEHGGAPPSILAFKDFVGSDVWEDVKIEKRQAAKRNEMMMLRGVGDGVSWMQRALSNKDMEYINNLKQNMTDIFNRMCPGLLSMLSENATEANALAARATYAEKTLWPMMEVIAQKRTSDVLPAYGRKLIGVFDDPRVVDRKLKLEEQKAYTLTHTIDQVNREYYSDDPIGDERGDLFVAQINAQSGGIQDPPPQPQPKLIRPPIVQPKQEEKVREESKPVTEQQADDVSMKAAVDDLGRWQRVAIRKNGKPFAFSSVYIPADVVKYVNKSLPNCKNEPAIKAMFTKARKMILPKPQDVAAIKALAESINRAAELMAQETSVPSSNNVYNMTMPPFHLTTQMPANGTTIVNMAEQSAPIVNAQIDVHNPEQPAPIMNSQIDVHMPEQSAPITQVVVNNPEQPAPVTNNQIDIHTPEQPAPVMNSQIDVHMPEQPAPITDVTIHNEPPPPEPKRKRKVKFTKKADGSYEGESE